MTTDLHARIRFAADALRAAADALEQVASSPVSPPSQTTVSIEGAARQLSVSVSTIRRLLDRGELPSVKVGRRRLIHRSALDARVREVL